MVYRGLFTKHVSIGAAAVTAGRRLGLSAVAFALLAFLPPPLASCSP